MHMGEMQKEIIAAGVIQGHSDVEIGRAIGMDRTTVGRARKSGEVNALIEAGFKEISGAWSEAVRNYKEIVEDYSKPIPEDCKGIKAKVLLQRREHGFKASERLLEGMGLLPSHSAPQYITNLMQINNNYVNPELDKLIDATIIDPKLDDDL